MSYLPVRLRRLRRTAAIRSLVQETRLHPQQLIAPLFINELITQKQEIKNMPGQFQLSLNCLAGEIDSLANLGIRAVLLFGIPAIKDPQGLASLSSNGIIQQAIRAIHKINKDLVIITDLCFCEYTDHGHCGILNGQEIDNDQTLVWLSKQAVSHAQAGADWVAPSGMMDGMVEAIRTALDKAGYCDVAIMSYAIKYCSSFYAPFRAATLAAPQFGDRKTYQMNPANANEAYREAALDVAEGADALVVKPAMNYLDVIYRIKQAYSELPLCAYQVSGEYSMLKNAALQGLIDGQLAMVESLLAIKRAGADFMITYFAKDLAKLLANNNFNTIAI